MQRMIKRNAEKAEQAAYNGDTRTLYQITRPYVANTKIVPFI